MLKKLYLRYFRNYSEIEIGFSPHINWLVGNNAQGKTNILEAIYLLSCGRSFRSSQLPQLISKGAPYFYIEALFEKDSVSQLIRLSYDKEMKRLQINATAYTHFTPLIGFMPMILYAPEDIVLISGPPTHRRKFLDLHLAQSDPFYLYHLTRYYRALKQRNELLKARKEAFLETWEEMMAPSALYLMEKRKELIHSLKEPLHEMVNTLSCGTDGLSIEYQPSFSTFDHASIVKTLCNQRKKELHIGTTLLGPHRDDILFLIGNISAKTYASLGQKHSILAAVRLCMWKNLKEQTTYPPLFGIDDFGAHLDAKRQSEFEKQLKELGQIFLTSPSPTKSVFLEKQIFQVDSGKVFQISPS